MSLLTGRCFRKFIGPLTFWKLVKNFLDRLHWWLHHRLCPGNRPLSRLLTLDPITAAQPSHIPQSLAPCSLPWPGGHTRESAVNETADFHFVFCPILRQEERKWGGERKGGKVCQYVCLYYELPPMRGLRRRENKEKHLKTICLLKGVCF